MKFIKKLLEQIPLEVCPKVKKNPDRVELIMIAKQVEYQREQLLVATFYHIKTKTPYCRMFQTKEKQTTKMYDTGKWTDAGIENIDTTQSTWISIGNSAVIADELSKRAGASFFGDDSNKDTITVIRERQRDVRMKKTMERNAADKNTTEQIMQRIPPLPEDMEQQILEGPMKYSRYLFYRRGFNRNTLSGIKEPQYFGYCTYCKKEHELDFIPKHREESTCPGCGSAVLVMARGISRSREVHTCNYMVWGTAGAEVYARMFVITRNYSGEPEQIKTKMEEVERFYFNKGVSYKFTPRYSGWGESCKTVGWEKKQQVTENYTDYYLYPHPKDVFKETCAEHSHMDDYIEQCHENEKQSKPMRYLAAYMKHPSIEHLLGCGLYALVQEKVNQLGTVNQVVDWKKSRPREMMGVTQPELEKIVQLKFSSNEILVYQKFRGIGVTLETDDVELIEMVAANNKEILQKFEEMGVKESIRYLKYQKRRWYSEESSYRFVYYQWVDYKNTAEKLHYNMSTQHNRFPPNLIKAHDSVASMLREQMKLEDKKRWAEEQTIWDKQYEDLKDLRYTDGTLMVRPVASREELITEGEVLEHCVAGYADRVRDGNTHILFIRRVEQPEEPYYTLNINKNGEFVQCHGYDNDRNEPGGTRPQFIKDFETRWMNERVKPWVKRKKQKEKQERVRVEERIPA